MDIARKLTILADAAKYDASCASSGAPSRGSTGDAGIGSTSRMGICHTCTLTLIDGAVRDLRSGEEITGPNEPIQTCVTAAAGDCTLDI